MHILFCNYEYPPLGGGGGIVNAQLAEELAKKHDVTVLTSRSADLDQESVENNVRIIRAPVFFRKRRAVANLPSMFAYVPMAIHMGRKLVNTQNFDIINTHFVVPTGPAGDAIAHFGGVPNVLSLHGGDIYDPSRLISPHKYVVLRASIRRLLQRADAVVGQSRNTIDNARKYYLPNLDAIRIPLGIPRVNAGTASRRRYGLSEDDVVLVTVGRLIPRKNIPQLIAAMETFKGKSVKLLVMGSGPLEAALKTETAQRQLQDQVKFLGFVSEQEKFEILNMSDIYVTTSQHEGFGLVFLEAMAAGIPVLCYNHGGQTDFLRDGETGYLVQLNDTQRFLQRLSTLVEQKALRQKMGATNKQLVEEYYIDNCAMRYENVFREVVELHAHQRKLVPSAEAQSNITLGTDNP